MLLVDQAVGAADRPIMKDLNKHIIPWVATKWYDLGLELLHPKHENLLSIIQEDHKNDALACCRRMFNEWLRRSTDATWSQLKVAATEADLNNVASAIDSFLQQASECNLFDFKLRILNYVLVFTSGKEVMMLSSSLCDEARSIVPVHLSCIL